LSDYLVSDKIIFASSLVPLRVQMLESNKGRLFLSDKK